MQEIATRFLARRTGIAASALHNYETSGLFKAQRNRAVQRRDPRSDIRRVSILIIAQKCGFLCATSKSCLQLYRKTDLQPPLNGPWSRRLCGPH
jgi:MerR family redox-sensitive transcriptional activator SoxR